jgi:hypothetical protein
MESTPQAQWDMSVVPAVPITTYVHYLWFQRIPQKKVVNWDHQQQHHHHHQRQQQQLKRGLDYLKHLKLS